MQYGIRLRQETEMSWGEFSTLLAGLNGDTPLGFVVQIRAEKDRKVISKFTREQKQIYNDWKKYQIERLKEQPKEYKAYIDNLQNWCKDTFSKRGD